MDRNSKILPSFTQDLSTLLASVIPVLQLFLTQLPPSVKSTFLASEQFVSVSIITLIISYVTIIAFQAKPWFEIVLPFQGKKKRKYQDYIRRVNEVSAASNFVSAEQATASKINEFLERLEVEPVKEPSKLRRDNIISFGLIMIIINAVCFIIISFLGYSDLWAALQSINYVFTVVFSVLVLSVYRNTVQNNLRFEEENKTKTQRAIELARSFNVFGELPQVRVVESFEPSGFPSNLNIIAECKGTYYEIITDSSATKFLRGRKLPNFKES